MAREETRMDLGKTEEYGEISCNNTQLRENSHVSTWQDVICKTKVEHRHAMTTRISNSHLEYILVSTQIR